MARDQSWSLGSCINCLANWFLQTATLRKSHLSKSTLKSFKAMFPMMHPTLVNFSVTFQVRTQVEHFLILCLYEYYLLYLEKIYF